VYVKIHLKTDQGIQTFTSEESTRMGGINPNYNLQDLFESIKRGDFPSWTVYVQVMTAEQAEKYRWNIFDMTKIWPHADFPLRQFGKLTLDKVVSPMPGFLLPRYCLTESSLKIISQRLSRLHFHHQTWCQALSRQQTQVSCYSLRLLLESG
jgi:Catalase